MLFTVFYCVYIALQLPTLYCTVLYCTIQYCMKVRATTFLPCLPKISFNMSCTPPSPCMFIYYIYLSIYLSIYTTVCLLSVPQNTYIHYVLCRV